MKTVITMKSIIILFLLSLCVMSCSAENEVKKISLQEAVKIVSENNMDIQSAMFDLSIEKNNIKIANRLENPNIETEHFFGHAEDGSPQHTALVQEIEIGKRGARKKLAEATYDLTEANTLSLQADLISEVREAYINLLAKKMILKTIKEENEFLQKAFNSAKGLNKIEKLNIKLTLSQMALDLNSAELEVKTALYDFNKALNCQDAFYDTAEDAITSDANLFSVPDLNIASMPDFDSIAKQAMQNRSDIQIALKEIEVAKRNISVAKRSRIPDLELKGGWSNQSKNFDYLYGDGALAGINIINIPILYTFKPEIQNAKLEYKQALLNYDSTQNKAMNDLKSAYETFVTAQINLKRYNSELILDSEELIKAAKEGWKKNTIEFQDLIDICESYRAIADGYTSALADYYNAWNTFIREVNNEDFSLDINSEDV